MSVFTFIGANKALVLLQILFVIQHYLYIIYFNVTGISYDSQSLYFFLFYV